MPSKMNIEVVKCKCCGKEEYYGMMHWTSGKTVCRDCIYTEWEVPGKWQRIDADHVFPLYEDGKDYRMHLYYASLVRGLIGYFVKFEAPSEHVVRIHLNEYFGRMWCSVYSEEEFKELRYSLDAAVINEADANTIKLVTGLEWE